MVLITSNSSSDDFSEARIHSEIPEEFCERERSKLQKKRDGKDTQRLIDGIVDISENLFESKRETELKESN